jgi:phage terminase small subunit
VAEEQTFEQLATDKEKLFVAFYVLCLNGAEAARRAEYPANSARQAAHELLTKPYIRAEVDRRLQERIMSANDVLARWSAVADADISPYLKKSRGKLHVDVEALKRDGLGFLIKSVKNTKFGQNIEFRDPDSALEKMGKVHRLLVERQELTGKDGGPIEIDDAKERLRRAVARHAASSGEGSVSSDADG